MTLKNRSILIALVTSMLAAGVTQAATAATARPVKPAAGICTLDAGNNGRCCDGIRAAGS